jgi:intracellular sulfur oxidation DsrE/DsrF family protein
MIWCLAVTASLVAGPAITHASEAQHRVVFHLDENDKDRMNLVLNNVQNVKADYDAKGESVEIEVVAYGPGLNMLVAGKSPVEDRVESMSLANENLTFSACGNTHRKMSEKAGKPVELMSEARMVDAGVVRLMELDEAGWTDIRP